MSVSKDLEAVVRDLVRENNVKLKELISPVVTKIAGEFIAAGLVPSEMEGQILVTGVDNFTLATRLVNACQTTLTMYPDKNFPKFIGILKKYVTMKLLAEEMESTFERARKSGGGSGGGASGGGSGGGASGGGASGGGASGGSQVILGTGDFDEVSDELRKFNKGDWELLGRKLGLNFERLKDIDAKYDKKDVSKCLDEALTQWLQKDYDKRDVKPPTWSNLANAVENARNPALAEDIRKNHPS